MCLIMTAIAAAIFTLLWLEAKKSAKPEKSLFRAALMFWAAALMWSVDGIASAMGGDGFFDLSREDALLGAIIIACGLFAYTLLRLIEARKKA